jgi:hypothetical protein
MTSSGFGAPSARLARSAFPAILPRLRGRGTTRSVVEGAVTYSRSSRAGCAQPPHHVIPQLDRGTTINAHREWRAPSAHSCHPGRGAARSGAPQTRDLDVISCETRHCSLSHGERATRLAEHLRGLGAWGEGVRPLKRPYPNLSPTFSTVFQFRAVPRVPSAFSITLIVSFDTPIPSG